LVNVQPYHIVPTMTKVAKNMTTILLDKTISTFPIHNPLYNCWGDKHWGAINLLIYLEYKLQYGEELSLLKQRDQNPE